MTVHPDNPPLDTLWLGVHKTGTTFLQKSLDQSQTALQAHGIAYHDLATFRRLYTRPLLHPDHPDAPAPMPTRERGQRQTLVFDENILALVQHALDPGGLYPDAANRARRVADHLGLQQPRLVLGLRNFRSFLPSLYCEALKSTPFRRFRKFCATPPEKLSWDDLIGRLIAVFPQSQIIIYTAEALRGHERDLLSVLTGMPAQAFTLLAQEERPGFSNRAVRALHDLGKTRPVTREDITALNKQFPRGPQTRSFDPWSPDEAAVLDARYADDIALLRARPGVQFLDPALAGSKGQGAQGPVQTV